MYLIQPSLLSARILLCQVEEHQLAHQCSPNISRIWESGICGLMGDLMGGAFMAYWVGHLYHLMEGHLYHLLGGAFIT